MYLTGFKTVYKEEPDMIPMAMRVDEHGAPYMKGYWDIEYKSLGYPSAFMKLDRDDSNPDEWRFYPNLLAVNIMWELILTFFVVWLLRLKKEKIATNKVNQINQ